ncbi:hypothetical protein HETIRDRAFT_146212 [Heterobasidion irregulare TC 32-1]|uniref:Uncharacterized protein n=1 Tax=Heterobasidion irregulare (strain TC 32-1) TaxID=747525 RepID=W4K9E6_HETIT|nr:uncharacterized protein HETIRDRAFT_146212 [Heterobasidion irregulare TC 32-1]ETW81975.1 hypothetical protein HETIRDRAFT_146212 [Heterobasidion irregulare TC 32-1]
MDIFIPSIANFHRTAYDRAAQLRQLHACVLVHNPLKQLFEGLHRPCRCRRSIFVTDIDIGRRCQVTLMRHLPTPAYLDRSTSPCNLRGPWQ